MVGTEKGFGFSVILVPLQLLQQVGKVHDLDNNSTCDRSLSQNNLLGNFMNIDYHM